LLTDDAWLGRALHALIGYSAQPTGMQVLFYLSIVVLLSGGARLAAPRRDAIAAVPTPST
jgi:high-affinity iron transporter